jgi:hypothetical protein
MLTPEKEAELAEKHPGARGLKHPRKPLQVILREPTRAEYKRFRATAIDDRRKPEAQEQLFASVCVWPETPAEREQLLEQWPACPEACSKLFDDMLGLTGVEQGKG